jgi:anti-sigma regulatory factor (Ser/Thr protein kinase)
MTVSSRGADQVLLRERFGLDNLADIRGRVRAAGLAAGLAPDLAEGLTMATSEGMANAIMHGGKVRTVTISVDDIGVVVEVYDDGHAATFGPPTHAPPPERMGGRGLLLASTLCDRLSVTTGREGTVLMLEVDYRH